MSVDPSQTVDQYHRWCDRLSYVRGQENPARGWPSALPKALNQSGHRRGDASLYEAERSGARDANEVRRIRTMQTRDIDQLEADGCRDTATLQSPG